MAGDVSHHAVYYFTDQKIEAAPLKFHSELKKERGKKEGDVFIQVVWGWDLGECFQHWVTLP